MSEQATPQIQPVPPADAGLHCPRCDYNLTGLPEPRCPECGQTFDWEQVRRAAANLPRIYFERARGWRKLLGFFVTWATVLFAPWVFARQAVQRISAVHALVFGGVCFASTLSSYVLKSSWVPPPTWLTTAAIYIVLQAVWLSILDVPGWRTPLTTFRVWLLIGCYTSAVMVTEVVFGPPPLDVHCLGTALSFDVGRWTSELAGFRLPHVLCTVQLLLWAVGIGCCYYARLRRTRRSRALAWPAAAIVAVWTCAAYAATIEYIGMRVYDWLS